MMELRLLVAGLLLDESLSLATLGGLVLILGGVALGSGAVRLARSRVAPVAEP